MVERHRFRDLNILCKCSGLAAAGAPRATRDNTNSLGSNPYSSEQRDHNKYNNIRISYSSSLLDMFIAMVKL